MGKVLSKIKYGIMDYEVIGDGTPVLIIHGWGISKHHELTYINARVIDR